MTQNKGKRDILPQDEIADWEVLAQKDKEIRKLKDQNNRLAYYLREAAYKKSLMEIADVLIEAEKYLAREGL